MVILAGDARVGVLKNDAALLRRLTMTVQLILLVLLAAATSSVLFGTSASIRTSLNCLLPPLHWSAFPRDG